MLIKILKIKTNNPVILINNINYDEFGIKTKIYHLPFDQKYDVTKIDKKGEFYAMTVREAEEAGFRRSFRWYGSN